MLQVRGKKYGGSFSSFLSKLSLTRLIGEGDELLQRVERLVLSICSNGALLVLVYLDQTALLDGEGGVI